MGSIDRLPSGHWRARYRDPYSRARSRSFARKRDAALFLDTASADMQRSVWVDPDAGRITLAEWAEAYLATVVNLRPGTLATYRRDLTRYILPRLGTLPLSRLSALEIRAWLAEEIAGGRAPSSVHRHYRTLRRVLEVAMETEMLAKNPCSAVQPPAVPATEMRFLSAAEVTDLAEAAGPWYATFIYTAAYTGLRLGELTALRRKRLDLLRRTVTVSEQLTAVDGRLVWGEPKTKAGRRTLSIPDFLVDRLKGQLSERALPCPDGLVFPNGAGNPIAAPSFTHNVFSKARRRSGLTGVRFHDLRHTAVALAIAHGAHPKAIQARMGHSSIQVTLDRYGHLFPELDGHIAAGLDEIYRQAERERANAGDADILAIGQRSSSKESSSMPQRSRRGSETIR
ncbi:MAG: tyrosine-type recombinase/integrase [Acidimicrobiales bacterium]